MEEKNQKKYIKKKDIEKEYKKNLKTITKKLHGGLTYNNELDLLGKKLFKNKFQGVYSYDNIPKIKNQHCIIFNLDKKNEPGSHWCALYQGSKHKYVYDSFGRKVLKGKGIINSELDAEQKDEEENCGQRCLAWLMIVYDLGIKHAIKI